MIDLRLLRDDPDRVRASQRARGEDPGLVDALLSADQRRRSALTRFESLRAEQKALGKQVGSARGDERAALVEKAQALAAEVKAAEAEANEAEALLAKLQLVISNVIEDGVPPGGEDDYVVLEHVGTPRDFAAAGFEPRDHVELGRMLNAIDIERGAKVSGSRFFYLRGYGAMLEHAIMSLCREVAQEEGFMPLSVPNLVLEDIMRGTGFLDTHPEDIYQLELDKLYLIGTSEVSLVGYHADEIVDLDAGPIRYSATSTCYRREAGSHGKDTRGIFRTHQFQKTEMVTLCRQEDADHEHERLLAIERRILDAVEVPYRVIDVAAGDLGSSAARKYDCEAWIASQRRYRELTSTSNCTTFQARRLNIRERDKSGSGTRAVATLNGTMATTRWIVAILENHQQADGSIAVPVALRPYLGGRETLTPGVA